MQNLCLRFSVYFTYTIFTLNAVFLYTIFFVVLYSTLPPSPFVPPSFWLFLICQLLYFNGQVFLINPLRTTLFFGTARTPPPPSILLKIGM